MILEFPRQIFEKRKKNTQLSHFIKIRPVGAEMFHADRRTDMRELIVASRSFANAPKNGYSYKRGKNLWLNILCYNTTAQKWNKKQKKIK